MKKGKRILALALAAVMAVSMMACGKKKTDPYAAAQENMANVKSMEATMLMEMDMEVSAGGESQTMEMDTQMDMITFTEPARAKVDMTIGMSMGELGNTSENMSMYMEGNEDGTYTMYMLYGDTWMSQEIPADEALQYDASSEMTSYMDSAYHYEEKGIEKLDSGNAYRYSGKITGDDLKEVLVDSGALDQLSQLGLDMSQPDALLEGVEDITVDLWIDEATLYPVKYELDMSGAMNALIGNAFAAMGDQAEGVSMSIPKMTISMTCSNYNAAEEFEIPAEAKAN